MLLLKSCPHCQGDLIYERDRSCGYLTCLQCGHVLSAAQERALGLRVTGSGVAHPVPPQRERPRTPHRQPEEAHARSQRMVGGSRRGLRDEMRQPAS